MKEFKQVIHESDIILEILDARDPMGCRCRDIEAEILGKDEGKKKIILVLNKIDLVPMPVVMAWKRILEREFACILFKANTQSQSDRLGGNKLFQNSLNKNPELANEIIDTQKSVGTDKLMQLIKNYSKTDGVKSAVTVGVIGFPNVGKSSIINSMKKQRAVGVSATAGFTKSLQLVEIDSKVKIIDSPGVILSNEDEVTLVLRNQINAAEVKDTIKPIEEILRRSNKEKIMIFYKIADFTNPTQFLLSVCQSRGKFKKGGIADLESTARLIIEDWNCGAMSHYLPPPGFDPSVLLDYDENMGLEINENEDYVPKITGTGFTITDKDVMDEDKSGMALD